MPLKTPPAHILFAQLNKELYNGKMFEVELKAHVCNREELIKKLNSFADYIRTVEKSDVYYHLPVSTGSSGKKSYISTRIRTERQSDSKEEKCTYYLTYKKKEIRQNADGISSELNDEKETLLSDAGAVEALLSDIGFKPALHKKKNVLAYQAQTEYGTAALELCTVGGLGDFIEIEILSETDDEKTVSAIQDTLKSLLLKCGIPLENIEPKYYSELLAEVENK